MAQKQPTAEQMAALQEAQNRQFMALSYEQSIKANAQNGTVFGEGKTLNFDAPIISAAYATKITLRHSITLNVAGGQATLNAGAPYNLVNRAVVTFGNKQVSVSPYLSKIFDRMRGYNRQAQGDSWGFNDSTITSLINSKLDAGATFTGSKTFSFDSDIELNGVLHPNAVNGILPIFSSGTKLQVALTLPTSVAGADPLENVIKLDAGATVTATGSVEVIITYRDYQSMATTQPVQPNLAGLPTVQVIELPSITPLTSGTMQYFSFRNPYGFCKLAHIVIDGKQSDKFAKADNILSYSLDKAENTSSSFFRYDESNGGMKEYYKEVRSRFGQDMDAGVLVWDATTQNVANVSSKMGTAYLNLTNEGFPASRFGVKVNEVDGTKGITPRVVSFGVILNKEGIRVQ